jgi:hypothetical protein
MNQLLGGGKKQKQSSSHNSNPLVGLAGQFLGGGGKHSSSGGGGHSSSGPAGMLGALAGGLMGGNKPKPTQQTNYSGSSNPSQGQSHGGGFMDSVGGMFGGHHGSSSVCYYRIYLGKMS